MEVVFQDGKVSISSWAEAIFHVQYFRVLQHGDERLAVLTVNRPIEMLVAALNVACTDVCSQVRERPGRSQLRGLNVKDHRNPPHDNRTDYREDGNTGITVCSRSSLKAMSLCGSAAQRDRHPGPGGVYAHP